MAGVAFDGVRITDADALSPATPVAGVWENTNGQAAALETDFFYQGTNSISEQVKTSELGVCFIPNAATYDVAVGPKVFLYKVLCTTSGILETTPAAGAKCEIGSGATAGSGQPTDYNQYFIATNTTYPAVGGWLIVPIDSNITQYVSNPQGTYTSGSTNYWGFVATYQASTKVENTAMDAIDYVINGTGLTISGTEAGFADFAVFDEDTSTNRYGVMTTREDVYYVLGTLTIGSGSEETAFTASNDVVVFPEGRFGTGFAGLRFNQYVAGNNHSLDNCTFIGKGTITGSEDTRPDYEFTGSTGTAVVQGSTYNVFRNIQATSSITFKECIFLSGAQLIQSSSTILSSTFSEDTQPSGSAFVRSNDLSTIARNSFEYAEGHAIEIYVSGTYDFVGNTFTDYLADDTSGSAIFNNSGEDITINVNDGDTPTIRNSAGSVTNVINAVFLNVTVQDAATDPILSASVAIYSGSTELMNEYTDDNGLAQETYNYLGDAPIQIRVRRSSPDRGIKYVPIKTFGTIGSTGLTTTIVLTEDTIAD